MNSDVFDEILKIWKNRKKNEFIWTDIANQFNYCTPEAARSSFKRERQKRRLVGSNSKEKVKKEYFASNVGKAKVIVFDIEFSPITAVVFDLYNQNISIDQILRDNFMLGWSAKYLNEPEIYSDMLTSQEAVKSNDERIVRSAWKLLNDADVLISHNGISYDEKRLNSRLLFWGLQPLKKHFSVDTLLIARQNFSFTSNKLKYLNKILKIKEKKDNEGIGLWIKCIRGEEDALENMRDYNMEDVLAEEDLYFKFLPYIKSHPNLALFFDTNENRCPNCGTETLSVDGNYYTPSGLYNSFRCNHCGAVCRSKQNKLEKDKKKSLLVN